MLLVANQNIPASAPCTHPLSVVRVEVPADAIPSYDYGRRHAKEKHAAIDSQVEEWLTDKVIEPCVPESPWNMGLVMVKKHTPEGQPQKYRVCIDPRPANKVTPNYLHPLPQILDYLDDACGAKVFSSLDLKGSFHQFVVEPSHR